MQVKRHLSYAQGYLGLGMIAEAAAELDRISAPENLAIEVLEYFDRIKFTRRVGDAHMLTGRDSHPGGAHGLQIR